MSMEGGGMGNKNREATRATTVSLHVCVTCQTFFFSFFPCSADHERDCPPCKVVFSGSQPIR